MNDDQRARILRAIQATDSQSYVFSLAKRGAEARAHRACPKCRGRDLWEEIAGLQDVVQRGKWAAETNQLLIDAIRAHKDAVSTGLLGKHEQDAADRALWAVAGF